MAKAKTKAKRRVTRKSYDERGTGPEPVFTEAFLEMSESEQRIALGAAFNYYAYHNSIKDLRKHINKLVKECGIFTAEEAKQFKQIPDSYIQQTPCSIAKAVQTQGLPFQGVLVDKFVGMVRDAISSHLVRGVVAEDEVATDSNKRVVKKPNIQDRLIEKMNGFIGDFDVLEDDVWDGKKVDPKSYDYAAKQSVPHGVVGRMIENFEARKAELVEAQAGTDEQLSEGYSHFKAADFKRFIKFYDDVIEGLEQYKDYKKATKKARVRKAPAKEKIVAKMKHMKECQKYKLVSINPTQIIGAQKLFIFDTKTRKLFQYLAQDASGLGVKGTTILGYSETESVGKTLRKPEQQLKDFMSASKVDLRKFISKIRGVEVKVKSRINPNQILLKVV